MGHTNLFTEDVKGDYAESMTEFLTASTLSALSGVRHGFFTKNCGNVGFSWAENTAEALESRRRIAVHLGVDSLNLLICRQIHSPDVVCVTKNWRRSDRPEADALVTNKTGIALGILTADCVPVLFADAENGVIGAAHAGWKGAVSGVLENTLAAMEKLGARRVLIKAALGPCIWQDSYEVGAEFPAPFLAEDAMHRRFFTPASKNGHYQFDLPGYVGHKLQHLGLESIAPSPADTCAAPDRFFSHRYSTLRDEKRGGNLLSVITKG